jgi:hypothetical protein
VGRELKAGAVSFGVIGLLLVVALAARGGAPDGSGRISQRGVPYAIQNGLLTIVVVVYVIVVLALLVTGFRFRHHWNAPESHWLRNFSLVVAFFTIVAIGYWAIARRPPGAQVDRSKIAVKGQQGPKKPVRIQAVPTRQAHFDWWLASSLVGLVVIGGAVVYVRARRPRAATERRSVEDELAQTVEMTIDELRGERDPRRAVVASYAAMERTLAARGLARRRSETPLEYLGRVLRELSVRESAVRSLTQLFEYAKFSAHEIDAGMKDDAIAALSAVRDDLRQETAAAA